MKKRLTYLLLFFCFAFSVSAQFDKDKFLDTFYRSNTKAKVILTASTDFANIKDIYPLIKDTLANIRRSLYRLPPAEEKTLRFLFDKIDADMALTEKNYAKATIILENAIKTHASSINDTLRCLSMLKNAFVKMHNINRAFEVQYLIESRWHRKSDSVKIDFGVPKSSLYFIMGLKEEAISERKKEFNTRTDKTDTDLVVNFYNDMGVFFNKKKLSDSAEFYFEKAKALLLAKHIPRKKETYYNFYKGLIDGNIALSYFNRGHILEALPLLKRDVYYSMKGNNIESAFNSYNLLVKCYIALKNKKLAGNYLDTAKNLLDEKLKSITFKLRLMPTMAEYYSFISDSRKAAAIYHEYYILNDSILLLEKEREVIDQEVMFSIEQREIEQIEKEKLVKQFQLEEARQRSYKAYLLAGTVLLCIIILFLTVNNRQSKKREYQLSFKNKQIQEQNAEIENSLKEKEALIKEIHHRVKNNLQIITSMLNLQMNKVGDEKTELILFEAKQRINAIALTHQMLYQKITVSNIPISEYIETLVKQIEATMATPLIKLTVDVVSTQSRLTIDGAVPLGLIINELLTNGYKHAFPKSREGKINVSLTENPNSFTIQVSDNGVGLGEDFNLSENKTLGMELVHILVEQLDSKLIVENNNGSTFKFDIQKTQLK